jgi:hypothetical protein
MQPWSYKHARSLTLEQWPLEIHNRFVQDFANRIDSLPLRDPIKSELAKFGVTEMSWPVMVDWDINSISFCDDEEPSTLFDFSGYFFVETPTWYQLPYGETAPEPVDGDETIMVGFDGVLHVDDAGVISRSEVLKVYTDLDMMPDLSISGGERDDAIFSFHNFS